MVSKVKIIKTALALENGLHYIGDAAHPDHADFEIGPEVRFGIDPAVPTDEFCKRWLDELVEDNTFIRRGRKRSRLAVLEIIRSPDDANLTPEEELTFMRGIQQAQGGAAVARRHRNKITGATDFHIYRFKQWGRNENPLLQLRVAADAAHEELNAARLLVGGKHVETMVEVRRRKQKDRGIKELAEQLQEIPGLTAKNLQDSIEKLGHKVTRFNTKSATISVQHAGCKRAHRYSITGLFERMEELKRDKVPVLPVHETPANPKIYSTPLPQEAPVSDLPAISLTHSPSTASLKEDERDIEI